MKYRIQVVGMGMDRADLCPKHLEVIFRADVLVGAERHLQWFADLSARRRKIEAPLSGVIKDIEEMAESGRVVVLASGDPLFFGIGNSLVKRFGETNVEIFPNVSSMAAAFARINRSWADAAAVSLHARDGRQHLRSALLRGGPVFVLTDPDHGPAQVAGFALEHGRGDSDFWAFERLGTSEERIRQLPLKKAAQQTYLHPAAVILIPEEKEDPAPGAMVWPGAPESDYFHDPGMITKAEVRAVVLSKLRPGPDHVLWDLGAASGSVAIEAALFVTSGRIVAVEKQADRAEHIRKNAAKFAPGRIEVMEKTLPGAMDELPDPDRVFIGGGGKDIAEIARRAGARLRPGGRIVANIVVLETLNQCLDALGQQGFAVETVQVQVNRSAPMPGGIRLEGQNPVFVVSAEKPL